MTRAVHELERAAGSAQAISAFLAKHEFPIVEGRTVTFVYRGDAQSVFLQHWVHSLPQQQRFRRLGHSDLWSLTLDVPEGSRIEYKIGLEGPMGVQLIQDPLNSKLASDPYGANSVVQATGYEVPDWSEPDDRARRGELHDGAIDSRALGGRRPVQIYVPARFRKTRRYPLLIAHDGADYLRFSALQTVLDNLIERLEIPPMIVALTTSPDRMREYGADERHSRFIADELLPWLSKRFPLIDSPSQRGLMGASFGAIAALSTAWRNPGMFGRLLLQSGSFLFTDIGEHEGGPHFDPVVEFLNQFREAPGLPSQALYLSCGTYEPMIYYNRSMVPLLQSTGMTVRFREARDGHNWENWRDRLREGLSFLFPGPLWMVYE